MKEPMFLRNGRWISKSELLKINNKPVAKQVKDKKK